MYLHFDTNFSTNFAAVVQSAVKQIFLSNHDILINCVGFVDTIDV